MHIKKSEGFDVFKNDKKKRKQFKKLKIKRTAFASI